jgi:hypothetical protein
MSSVALAVVLYVIPIANPMVRMSPVAARQQHENLVQLLQAERGKGHRVLVTIDILGDIAAGNWEIPRDRGPSAFELYAARQPVAKLLFQRISEGKYDTVIGTVEGKDPFDPIAVGFYGSLKTGVETCCVLDPLASQSLNGLGGVDLSVYRRR